MTILVCRIWARSNMVEHGTCSCDKKSVSMAHSSTEPSPWLGDDFVFVDDFGIKAFDWTEDRRHQGMKPWSGALSLRQFFFC